MNEAPLLAGLYLYGELEKQNLSLAVQETGPTGELASLVGVSIDHLSELGKMIPLYEHHHVMSEVCPKLAPVVREELKRSAPVKIEIDAAQREKYEKYRKGIPYALGRCITCHAERNFATAPYIPFDRPELLRQQLHADHDFLMNEIIKRTDYEAPDDFRMPKGPVALLPAQSRQLITYLKSL
jgi:hypothetical protein